MFLRVVILVFAATCCTARVIDISDEQSAWEQSGKFEGDIMLTDEDKRNGVNKPAIRWPNEELPFFTEYVFNVSDNRSAWERSGKFEGDIVLADGRVRNGVINPARHWRSKVIPFVIDRVFTAADQERIMAGINEFNIRTTIRMVRHNSPPRGDYIHITGQSSGCWSYVGRAGGRQQLNLQRGEFGCINNGIIIHEILHTLGFYHQHSATDRDDYVTINWQNILKGQEQNFNKYDAKQSTSFGVPYDYDSVMHYGPYAFSKNGLPTVEPKDLTARIGQRDGFSAKDILKLEKMYENKSYENSSYATRSQFITLIIATLLVLTNLQ